jgi:exodeoxyribonuclease VII small subunit
MTSERRLKMANKANSFEASIVRLEEIVRKLESGEASLDESIELYSEGVKLVGECNKRLDETERKIKLLTVGENGEMTEKDFN